ncbi:isoleucine--tRNA ligase [Jeotgalicoccus coquinae]|uniref:Isoleucine--tRNA ligase n=1 Tax=Jeotgalicoccus coquinae TaxID=709509 RepID=A0A6V7RJ58_9STAP|nr:isoleucine--tRNA ligase [Jeotgalicoccus coquinae]MBB6422544.1 isoleucyl-tRNA synthetase [Jeotgalicoccus coquinae]GGE15043.1 isoleucine--tRNA ligase [Jeotgalicoccus coquinae]CAD2078155.1 Isoleucine--tRNA ligase [Jeotgalicoccus coquinae]
MDYKDTLLMPKTAFKMRGGLVNKEPKMQQHWEDIDLYNKKLELNKGNTPFVLHDGPPYANGNLHMGHALNKIIKDFINRNKQMQGYYTPYVPGWDTHGLPIEQALTNKGVDRKSMSIEEFRNKCIEFANSQIDIQRDGFKRMGIDGEWDNPYLTYKPEFEASQIRVLKDMVTKGLIYKGKKPIYWSPTSESSLAEAELEYQDKKSPSIYVAFKVKDGKDTVDGGVKFVIWTTTPWTIPSNLALAVHKNLNYVQFNYNGEEFIVAEDLLDTFADEVEFDKEQITRTKEFKGSELEYITAEHPLFDRESLVVLGDHVTTEAGTGVVHTAPGHGDDDFKVGQQYGLDVLSPVDNKGVFTEEAGKYAGMFYDDANKVISDDLKEAGALLKLSFYTHSYPHDWRTKKPVIFRATPQWFASIEGVREDILNALMDTKFQVEWNRKRMYNMIKNRGDWVISRQRVWGVPLPFFYGENGEEIIDADVLEHVATLFEEHGSNIWFEWDAKDLLPEGYTHESAPNGVFTKETDIMDVWFDSGSTHRGVLDYRENLTYPADLYFEGSDQYRGWFNSSLITSVATRGHSPYKELLSHGFVMDGQGKKMSKSLGNVILPTKVMQQMGADIIRLWVMSSDFQEDVRVSDDILKQVSEVYRKIRNTFRFLLGNVNDFNPAENNVAYEDLFEVDKYMYNRFNELKTFMLDSYDRYDYVTMYQTVQNFINVDLSNFYLDYGKDILYIEDADAPIRRSLQTVLYKILKELNLVLAPVLVHTAEEIYEHTPHTEKESVHLELFPDREETDAALIGKWQKFMTVRDDVYKALEAARNEKIIGKSLDAKVTLTQPADFNLDDIRGNLEQFFIVSQVEVADAVEGGTEYDVVTVKVEHADGERCDRCWNYSTAETLVEGEDDICPRCREVVDAQ